MEALLTKMLQTKTALTRITPKWALSVVDTSTSYLMGMLLSYANTNQRP